MWGKASLSNIVTLLAVLMHLSSVSAKVNYYYCGAGFEDARVQAKVIVSGKKACKALGLGQACNFKLIGRSYPQSLNFDGLDDEQRKLEAEVAAVHNQILEIRNSTKATSDRQQILEVDTSQQRKLDACSEPCNVCDSCVYTAESTCFAQGGCCEEDCGTRRNLRSNSRDLITTAEAETFELELKNWLQHFNNNGDLDAHIDCDWTIG